jgi:hypothetical protein
VRAVVTRVSQASATIDGDTVGSIGAQLLALVGDSRGSDASKPLSQATSPQSFMLTHGIQIETVQSCAPTDAHAPETTRGDCAYWAHR